MHQKITFGGVDALRFVAAVSVVLHHYGFWAWAYPSGIAGRAASVAPQQSLGTLFAPGWVGVQLFFVISGFVIAFSADGSNAARFLSSRVRRLVPAVLICAPITAAFALAFHVVSYRGAVGGLTRAALFVPFGPWIDSVYWTLGIEVAFYAVVYVLLLSNRFHLTERVVAAIGVCSTAFWVLLFAFDWQGLRETRALSLLLLHHGCFFATGVTLWLLRFKGFSRARIAALAVYAVGGALQITATADSIGEKVGMTTAAAPALLIYAAGFALLVASLRMDLRWRGWRQIGIMTYPLYLLHNVVGAALIGVLVERGVPYVAAMALAGAVLLAASWMIATALEPLVRTLLDRWPVLRASPQPHP